MRRPCGLLSERGADQPFCSLCKCSCLYIKPLFPAVGAALAVVRALKLGRVAKPLCNVAVIDQCRTAPAVLAPGACTVQQPSFQLLAASCFPALVFCPLLVVIKQANRVSGNALIPCAPVFPRLQLRQNIAITFHFYTLLCVVFAAVVKRLGQALQHPQCPALSCVPVRCTRL